MKPDIFSTINAGLYFWNGRTGLFVDAIHRGQELGFSNTPGEIFFQMTSHRGIFERKNDFLFTHIHEDHFDRELLSLCRQEYRDCIVYGPDEDISNISSVFIEKGVYKLKLRDYHIWIFETPHDGKRYRGCLCYAYLIKSENIYTLICSDAILSIELMGAVRGRLTQRLDKIFINLYQFSSESGREFLRELKPKEIWLYHLPYEQDDSYHCRKAAVSYIDRYSREFLNIKIVKPMNKL